MRMFALLILGIFTATGAGCMDRCEIVKRGKDIHLRLLRTRPRMGRLRQESGCAMWSSQLRDRVAKR